jgi:hypothetical protein
MNKPKVLYPVDFVASALAVILILPTIYFFFGAMWYVPTIEVRQAREERHIDKLLSRFHGVQYFKNEQHIEEITSAFQFELAPIETLVLEFFPGYMQARPRYRVIIEDVESVEAFLARFYGDYEQQEIDPDSHHFFTGYYPHDIFKVYSLDIFSEENRHRDFYNHFAFFYDGEQINAEFRVQTTPMELRAVSGIMSDYYPSWWQYPYLVVSVVIQASLILFVVIRVARRKKEIARANM